MNNIVYIMTMPERLHHVETQLHVLENSNIINAYNDINMEISKKYVENVSIKRKELCAYTYIHTLSEFLKTNYNTCVIFEDDVTIKPELKNDLKKIVKICVEYDFIYLYRTGTNYTNVITIDGIEFINNISDGNHAIMWSRNGAKKFFDNLPIKLAKDYWLRKKISAGVFNALTTTFNYIVDNGAKNSRDMKSKMGSSIYGIKPIE